MKEENKDLEDFFKKRLADFSSEPSEDLWNKLKPQITSSSKRYKFWYGLLSILFLIWIIFSFYWFFPQKNTLSNIKPSSTQTKKDKFLNNSISEKPTFQSQSDSTKKAFSKISRNNPHKNSTQNLSKNLENSQKVSQNSAIPDDKKSSPTFIRIVDNKPERVSLDTTLRADNQSKTNEKENYLSTHFVDTLAILPHSNLNQKQKNENIALLSPQNISWEITQITPPIYSLDSIDFQGFPKKMPRYLVGFVAPLYTFQYITPNPNDSIWINSLKSTHSYSVSNTGFQIGVGYEKNWNNRWNTSIQVSYKSIKAELTYHYIFSKPDSVVKEFIDAQTLLIKPFYTAGEQNNRIHFKNIGLQIQIGYILHQSLSFSHQLRFGIEAENNLSSQILSETKSSTQSFWTNINGGYYLRYRFNQRLGIFLSPQLSYYIGNVFQEDAFKMRPHTFQVKFGASWRLR